MNIFIAESNMLLFSDATLIQVLAERNDLQDTLLGLREHVKANQNIAVSITQTAKQAVYRRASGRGRPSLVDAAERLYR